MRVYSDEAVRALLYRTAPLNVKEMDGLKKAASGAVDTIRNSPLFRRKFGTRQSTPPASSTDRPEPLHPESDMTPFVQGVYFNVEYLGKQAVPSSQAQNHGCTEEPVALLWNTTPGTAVAKAVSVKVTTTTLRIKETGEGNTVLYEFPLFRMSYCGTDKNRYQAVSFVAKDDTDGKFYCFVFRCSSADKAYALALTIAKAFYLAYQILQAQEGRFPPTPERAILFEPQTSTDTKTHPNWPTIPPTDEAMEVPQEEMTDSSPSEEPSQPDIRVTRPSLASVDSDSLAAASADEDFTRLAKARSNPDILRSTLDAHDIKTGGLGWSEVLRLHADPGSQIPTPLGSTEHLVDDTFS